MKIALVHDWLTGMRGGERCLQTFLRMYPDADILTMLHVQGSTCSEIDDQVRQVSWLGKLPLVDRYYRALLPLYPRAIRSLDLGQYDFVISLSHAAAKNVPVPAHVRHVSYCFTPMRYVWDQAEHYFGRATPLLSPALSQLRRWDLHGAKGVEQFVAISRFVAARIRCFYGRSSSVIHPPVDTSWIRPLTKPRRGEAFLCAGALVPYKRVELAVRACSLMGEKLWIVGRGPEEERLRRIAGPTVSFFGHVPDRELGELYANCRALIFPGTEDFGMVPIECLAAGRPVIGVYDGALRETLHGLRSWESQPKVDGTPVGVFFAPHNRRRVAPGRRSDNNAELDGLMRALQLFAEREGEFSAAACRVHATRFSVEHFQLAWDEFTQAHQLPRPVTATLQGAVGQYA